MALGRQWTTLSLVGVTSEANPSVVYGLFMAGLLKRQRLLVATGFTVVAVAFGGQIVTVEYHSGSLNSGYELFFGVAYTVAYGLLASATWEWFRWLEDNLASGTGLTRVFRLLACANLVFAIGLVSVTYYWVHEAISTPYDGKLSIAIPTTNGLQLFGFCLVSAGFWWAASVLGAARPDLTPAESNAGEIADIDVPI